MRSFLAVAKLVAGLNSTDTKVKVDIESNDLNNRDELALVADEEIARLALRNKVDRGNHNKLHPVIFWEPTPLTYKEPLAEAQLNAYSKDFKARDVYGEYFYTPNAGTVLNAGTHSLTVTFVPKKVHKYCSVTVTRDVVVHKRKPQVTWEFPFQELLFGTTLGEEHFKGVHSELPGGTFVYSHEVDQLLPIGIHKMTVEFEPSKADSANYCRGYASVTFSVVGTYVPIVWNIPFCTESYAHFTKHVEAMVDSNTLVVSSPPQRSIQRLEKSDSRGGQRRKKKNVAIDAPSSPAAVAGAGPTLAEFHPESEVFVTTLPNSKRSSKFFAGAPIIYPEPLPGWLYQGQAVFYNAETQQSEEVAGRFEYDPPEGTQLPAGTYNINLTFYPENLLKYRITRAVRKVNILKSPVPLEWPLSIGMTEGKTLDEKALNCTNLLGLPGKYTYEPDYGAALTEGLYVLKVRFDPEDAVNYHSASTTVDFQVRHKKVPNIHWATPPDIVHPFPLSKLQLNAACRGGGFYRGKFIYEPDFDTILDAGTHTLKVTFYPELPTVAVTSATVELVVHKGLSRLIWNNPEPLIDGQGLYDDVLTCKCTNLPGGTFIYDPPAGTMLNAGPHKLCVRYIPDDPNYMETEMYIKMQVKPKPLRAQSKYYVS